MAAWLVSVFWCTLHVCVWTCVQRCVTCIVCGCVLRATVTLAMTAAFLPSISHPAFPTAPKDTTITRKYVLH